MLLIDLKHKQQMNTLCSVFTIQTKSEALQSEFYSHRRRTGSCLSDPPRSSPRVLLSRRSGTDWERTAATGS